MGSTLDHDAQALGRVLAGIPSIVLLVGRDGVIRYINRVEAGYDRAQVTGMQAERFLFPASRDAFEAALSSVLSTGDPSEYEFEASAADGSSLWFRCHLLPYREGDSVDAAVLVATNITELKLAEETAAKLRQLLPICSWCDRIQNTEGVWESIERYLEHRLQTQITHGMCPECCERQLTGLDDQGDTNGDAA